jgi:hypothetical protein
MPAAATIAATRGHVKREVWCGERSSASTSSPPARRHDLDARA